MLKVLSKVFVENKKSSESREGSIGQVKLLRSNKFEHARAF